MIPEPTNWRERIADPKKAAFLAAYEVCGTIRGAIRAAQISPTSHYTWLKEDPEYAALFEEAKEAAIAMLEESARERAIRGVVRKKFTKSGEPIIDPETGQQYTEREYSDALTIFLLKAARPEVYRERYDHNHSGEITTKRVNLPDGVFPPMGGGDAGP